MNLKEAFRYQNKLQSLLDEALNILSVESNITVTETTYFRHKAAADEEDETVISAPKTEYHEKITGVARFVLYLLNEKSTLSAAIRKTKAALETDFDGEISINATRQVIARIFRKMNDLRSTEQVIQNGGTGYRFNAAGDQVPYRCDVKTVTTINYDRNVIRAELCKLNKASDETSAALDYCLVTSTVDYAPPFDVNTSFAEAFDTYINGAAV